MAIVRECTFTSIWDDGAVVVTTAAKIDLSTGRVFDIGKAEKLGVDDNGVENLDREYIRVEGINKEFAIQPYDDASCLIYDLAGLESENMRGRMED